MLTDNEKRWLQNRNRWGNPYCARCDGRYHCREYMLLEGCPLNPDFEDAAEFSERVAAKLANVFQHINDYWIKLPCDACPHEGKCNMDCNDSILKWARLQVEEEMENDR